MMLSTPASNHARQLGLISRRRSELDAAEQAIRAMGPDAIPFLLQVIEEQARVVKRRKRLYGFLLLAPIVFSLTIGLALMFRLNMLKIGSLLCFISLLLKDTFSRFLANISSPLRAKAGALFAEIAGKAQISQLIHLLEHTEDESSDTARTALTRIFSQFQASDTAYLTLPDRKKLAARLARLYGREGLSRYVAEVEADFTVALLQALQQIGDSSFLEPVSGLCKKELIGSKSRSAIQAAAEECRPYLEAFAEQEAKSGMLVRSASAPEGEAQSAILVRPATSAPDTEPTVLLRPAGREEAK